ncbi:MAG: nuclear transport factor 2 family protein [Acidobacteria bacterium]|nr:nuclear transport factor 2 family protein [Acidobacteriota bacterium]
MSALTVGLAFLLWLQNPADLFQKAPPAVDEALRARVKQFFQAHVDGKFRAAAEVVAEDSQDAFFAANKPRCYSFEIASIEYSDNFTRARVVVACEMDHPAPGLAGVKVKAPRTSLWKQENGQWWYYIDPSQGYRTPFGVMKPGPGQVTTLPPVGSGGELGAPPGIDIEAALSWVKADKKEFPFSRVKPGSGEIKLTNRGPDTATLVLTVPPMPGLEVTLDRTELKKGETARLIAHWKPGEIPPPPTISVQIMVQPTSQYVDLRATFAKE